MKILRYVSDLHLEKRKTIYHPKLIPLWDFKQNGEEYYLALLGDIGNPYDENLIIFFDNIYPKYNKIFYVTGNHEYYNYNVYPEKTKEKFDEKLKMICSKYPNIILMNNSIYDVDNIRFIGSTLWSYIPNEHRVHIGRYLNDYHLIKKYYPGSDYVININIDDTNTWNKECISFIKKSIDETDKLCIILTHHAPLFSDSDKNYYTAHPKYLAGKNNYAFHNNLEELLKAPVIAWLYGHTHYASKFVINNVIVATNQLGYEHEEDEINFNPYAHINLNAVLLDNL